MKFDPLTDHFVQGFFADLPQPGSQHRLRVNGRVLEELVVESWWTDEPIRDPAIGGKRHAALITRTVS